MKAVWWIKRDFRIYDNQCLWEATAEADVVLPFFCWEKKVIEEGDYSSFHLQAQWDALHGLIGSLGKRGVSCRIVQGDVVEQLELLYTKMPFNLLYSHQETGNLVTFKRDTAVQKWCRKHDIKWIELNPSSVMRGGDADRRRLKLRQSDYRKEKPLGIPDLSHFQNLPQQIEENGPTWTELTSSFPKFHGMLPNKKLMKVNEKAAWTTMDSFFEERGIGYAGGISSPNTAFTNGSRLSSHLAWGTVSLRTIFDRLDQRREALNGSEDRAIWNRSLRAFESRLFWRDHFIQRLEAFPELEKKALNSAYADLKYEDDPAMLDAWINGKTGYPMVDACMRCLAGTGFLNFRMRAMVVSFACYGLHLSWKTIHEPLARLFHDYEPGIHLSQLQMQAGVIGFNAIRVYSPTKQFLDHDPHGKFVKKWIPELKERTNAEIAHAEKSRIGGYFSPVVDLSIRSKEMKSRVFEIRKSVRGRDVTKKVLAKHGSRKSVSNRKRKSEEDNQMTFLKTL